MGSFFGERRVWRMGVGWVIRFGWALFWFWFVVLIGGDRGCDGGDVCVAMAVLSALLFGFDRPGFVWRRHSLGTDGGGVVGGWSELRWRRWVGSTPAVAELARRRVGGWRRSGPISLGGFLIWAEFVGLEFGPSGFPLGLQWWA